MINILFFASFKEKFRPGLALESAADVETVNDLIKLLRKKYGEDVAFLDQEKTMVAINQSHACLETPVADGDEIAFFPPVTGG